MLTIWWCPCAVFSCVTGEGVCYNQCDLFAKLLLASALLILYTELYKKELSKPDNHDGVIIHLEPDILESKVKDAKYPKDAKVKDA